MNVLCLSSKRTLPSAALKAGSWVAPANLSPLPAGTVTGFVHRGRQRDTATHGAVAGKHPGSQASVMRQGSPAAPQACYNHSLGPHSPTQGSHPPVALAMASGLCPPFPWAHGLLRGKLPHHRGHVVLREAYISTLGWGVGTLFVLESSLSTFPSLRVTASFCTC